MIEFVTVGEITIDDTVTDIGEVRRAQTGGGAVYSALGIRMWGHRVGVNAVIGHDYPDENLARLNSNGIDTEGINRISGWSLRLWLLHEENNKKQQLPKMQSSTFAQLDTARPDLPSSYQKARGFHLAPATPEGQMRTRDFLRRIKPDALISLDILTEPFINSEVYQNGSALRGIDIFSPSIVEVDALWPGKRLEDVLCHVAAWGVRWIAIKMDTRGSLVHDARKGVTIHLPIYPAQSVDTTGAGDAFSGGFLEGLAETGDVVEAGMRATVAASFAVEDWGAFHLLNVGRPAVDNRLVWLRNHVNL